MSTNCLGCGLPLEGRRLKVFCTNACQQAHPRRVLLDARLATGVCGRTSYQGHYVREYLSEQQDGRCAICGIDDTWNGVALALIVDHVNGDATNDRRENLRLICPNCDSQLPTFQGKESRQGSPLPAAAVCERAVVLTGQLRAGAYRLTRRDR